MKSKIYLSVSILAIVILAASVPALAQSQPESKSQKPATAAAASFNSDDQRFVRTVAASGKTEVALGRLALERAQSAEVKQFAQRMIDDHTKAGDELRQLAAGKGFSWDEAKVKSGEKTGLPTRTGDETRTEKAAEAAATRTDASAATAAGAMADSSQTGLSKDGQKSVDKLSKHSGADFDREYMKLMVKNHDKSVALFERQAGGSGDSELKAWASQTLPTLREHQRLARELSTKVGASAAVDRATDRATGDQVRRP